MIKLIMPQNISLNGEWDFVPDSSASFSIDSLDTIIWRSAIVPLSWQAQFEDLRDYQGVAWYKKTFTLNSIDTSKAYILKFDAVEYVSKLYVNGQFAGENEGGYTPFEFDVTNHLHADINEIVLRVMDPLNEETPTEGISYWYIPHGKQTWYVQNSGIWQSVTLLIKPDQYIKTLQITPDINGYVIFKGKLNKSADGNKEVYVKIFDPAGQIISDKKISVQIHDNEFSFSENVTSPLLWSFDHPNLYQIEISAGEDSLTEKFGFRSIEAKNNKLLLNGKPFYMIGALDQDFYPETIYTTPSEDYLRDQMIKAKQLGLNLLRCHIKVPDPLYLKVADEVGLLVWYELPNWGQFRSDAAERGSLLLDKMIERDWNHPSLIIISIINESWGLDLQKEDQRSWLIDEFDRVKALAVGRLVVDNSACWGNFHLKTDINDYHTYWAIPENKNQFDKTIEEFAARPNWLFSSFGDSQEKGDEPLLISEFGNWGLPILPEVSPWWFERKFLDIEVSLPAGVHNRFNEYKLDEIFVSYNELAEESQHAQFNALKYEIEKLRMTPEIQGYVITEFTDINWESNGLLDMWRNFKVSSNDIPFIQQQDIIIPRPAKYNYSNGEEVRIDLYISHYSQKDLSQGFLEWEIEGSLSEKIMIDNFYSNVTQLESINFNAPAVDESGKLRIDFRLIGNDKKLIARNYIELFVFPEIKTPPQPLFIHSSGNSFNQFSDYLESDFTLSDESLITISNTMDSEIISRLTNGESVICLIDSTTSLPGSLPYMISSREEEWLDGNWATNLNWIRDDNILFKGISFGKSFGFEIAETIPKKLLTAIPAEEFSDVLSGMYVGWLHKNSAYVFQMKAGNGKLIFCTFPLAEKYSTDPFAKRFLQNLISYINSAECNPDTQWKLE